MAENSLDQSEYRILELQYLTNEFIYEVAFLHVIRHLLKQHIVLRHAWVCPELMPNGESASSQE